MNRFAGTFLTCIVVAASCWGTQLESAQRHQSKLVNHVQQIPVSTLDTALPAVPLVKWLAVEAGADAKVEWGVRDCRDVQGVSVDAQRVLGECVEADAYMNDGRSILLVVAVESSKPAPRPNFCFGNLVTPRETISLHQLSDLPVALIRTHGTMGYPEIAQ